MEGMVQDLDLAGEMQRRFEEWKTNKDKDNKLGLDLSLTVLTIGNWPTYKVQL